MPYRDRVARRVLFLRNDRTAPEALLGEVFAEKGFDIGTFDVVPGDDPVVPVRLPDPTGYDVIVPLGARWAVYDDRVPWVAAEMAMIRAALDAGAGVLGVCFGGQLLAAALGGAVQRAPQPEIGWYDVRTDSPAVVPGGPWFQWHFDRISTIPPGAVEVARTDGATQAFVRGRALGLQFHPELDAGLLETWIAEDRDGEISGAGLHVDDLRAATARTADDAVRRLRLLVAGFLALTENALTENARTENARTEDAEHGPLRLS